MLVHHETRDFARQLRRRLSLPEVLLWRALKTGKVAGLKFRKQHPLSPYVLDFYCHRARLCVEVDGGGHGFGDTPDRDDFRDRWLAEKGIRTLRLRAAVILEDVDNAVSMILEAAAESPERLSGSPLSRSATALPEGEHPRSVIRP